ncbi:hypothetical protein FACS1894158_08110 [Betaproteobacteria bacterium]|nr:hypothetical protein FACS1894158_08110 [Betaproteobacteria bacterium]
MSSNKNIGPIQISPDAKVLIVDDSSINLKVAVAYMARHNIKAETAQSGISAIEMIRNKKYDLVFMDHMMPGLDGIATVRRIRSLDGEYYKKVPIVALSANIASNSRKVFLEGGMNDFIPKPIKYHDMSAILLKWLPNELLLHDNVPSSPSAETRELPPRFDNLSAAASVEVTDLSISKGIGHVDGNKSVYVNILSQFCNGLNKDIYDIREFMKEKNQEDYFIRLHALTGALANIGNDFLSDWAAELATASKTDDIEKYRDQTEKFFDRLKKFRAELLQSSLMAEANRISHEKKKISAASLTEKLQELSEFCLNCDTEGANALASELKKATLCVEADRLIDEICLFVEFSDYDLASSKCEELTVLIPKMAPDTIGK